MRETDTYEDLDEFDDIFGDLNMTMLHSGEKHLVFVYGTLMKYQRNNDRLMDGGARLIEGNAYIVGNLSMKCRETGGGYNAPIVIQEADHKPARVIVGELYEISEQLLHALDVFEGHPEVYQREKVYVETTSKAVSNKTREAWVYYYVADVPENVSEEKITVDDGGYGRYHYKWRGL